MQTFHFFYVFYVQYVCMYIILMTITYICNAMEMSNDVPEASDDNNRFNFAVRMYFVSFD